MNPSSWLRASILLIVALSSQFLSAHSLVEDLAKTPIMTPTFSKREIAKIRLDNDLEAYIISDPNSHISGAALTVLTGSYMDPTEFPGMAHLVEHMTLRGGKLPFSQFITEHGGTANGFTTNLQTTYLFTIDNGAFEEAIKHFAALIQGPSIQEDQLKSEVHVIDAEYAKACMQEESRSCYVMKDLALPTHPHHAFAIGNAATLGKITIEDLREWRDKNYSTDRMRLIIVSPKSIHDLIALAEDNYENLSKTSAIHKDIVSKYPKSLHEQIVYIEPLKHVKRLNISWEIPESSSNAADKLVAYILGNEGEKSLLASLKNDLLATALVAGSHYNSSNNRELFLQIDMTVAGTKNVEKIITKCYAAIASIKEKKIPKWLFDELQSTALREYQFQQREDLLEFLLSYSLLWKYEPLASFPERSFLLSDYDAAAIAKCISALTPENAVISVVAPSTLTKVPVNSTEPWMGTKYSQKPITQETLDQWKSSKGSSEYDYPDPNPYITKNIASKALSTPKNPSHFPIPALLVEENGGKVYYAEDGCYGLPISSIVLTIKTPVIDPANVDSQILADLFIDMIKPTLSPITSAAKSAGIDVTIRNKENGIVLAISGFSDQAPAVLEDILTNLMATQVDERSFKAAQSDLFRKYQSHSNDAPLTQAYELFGCAIEPCKTPIRTKLPMVNKVSFPAFQKFTKNLFKETYIEGIIFGSLSKEQATELIKKTQTSLHSKPYLPKKHAPNIAKSLPSTPQHLDAKSKLPSNAALLVIQIDDFSPKMRATQLLLMRALEDPFFQELRSKQQAGYLVHTSAKDLQSHLYNTFAVQSSTHDGRDLIARYELFLEQFHETLSQKTFSKDTYDKQKLTLVNELKAPPKGPKEMGNYLYTLAFTHNGDFHRTHDIIAATESLTYEEFISLAQQMIAKGNQRRLAITLSGNPLQAPIKYRKISSLKQLRTENAQ